MNEWVVTTSAISVIILISVSAISATFFEIEKERTHNEFETICNNIGKTLNYIGINKLNAEIILDSDKGIPPRVEGKTYTIILSPDNVILKNNRYTASYNISNAFHVHTLDANKASSLGLYEKFSDSDKKSAMSDVIEEIPKDDIVSIKSTDGIYIVSGKIFEGEGFSITLLPTPKYQT